MHRVLEKVERVASGYLFMGPPDSSKLEDALAFAEKIGCSKFDLVRVAPDGASLKIEQVRELQGRIRYGPSAGEHLLVIVERADEMTPDAAAAFLKTLEEPPPGVAFILLVEREDRIPQTIVSRCQKVLFGEKEKKWEPDPAREPFYSKLRKVKGKSILELFELSSDFEKQKESIEALLYDLVYFAKEELQDLKMVRTMLEAAKNIKKRANFKLTLDSMCLKMGGT
jgi:DNA polymerase III delta prime subunit